MSETQTLSDREIEILTLIATGRSNKEIAGELHITTNTVKVHVRNIFNKLEVSSRTEASMVALRNGLIETWEPVPVKPETEEIEPAANPVVSDLLEPSLPVALPTTNGPNTQTWFIAGFLVVVTLLTVIAFRLFRPNIAATPTPAIDPIAVESQWRDRPNLPEARTNAAAVSLENQIYVVGGLVEGVPSADVLRFDPEQNSWSSLQKKPTAVEEIQGAVLGGRIYVPGGKLLSGEVTAVLEIYNPLTDSWEVGPEMPAAVSAYALAAHEGKIYVFGGWNGQSYSNRVFLYNPDTGDWREQTSMPVALGYAGAAVAGGLVYVIGGFDGESAARSTLAYTPVLEGTSPWKIAADMPEGRYAMGLVSVADKIHLIGGLGGQGDYFSQMDYTPQTNLWQVIENPLAGEWAHIAAAALGTDIYALGGEINGNATDRSLSYQVLFVVVIPVIR